MNSYGLSDEQEKLIIQYCYDTMGLIQSRLGKEFFEDKKIRKSYLLEEMYDSACLKCSMTNDFRLTKDELEACYRRVKMSSLVILGFLDGKNDIAGVQQNDTLVFKQKIKLKKIKNKINEVKD